MVKKIGIIALLAVVAVGYWKRHSIMALLGEKPKRTINTSEVKLLFRTPPSFFELKKELVAKGVVANASDLDKTASEFDFDSTKLCAGKYVILSGTRLNNLLDGFQMAENGHGKKEVKVNVIFNNCIDIPDVGGNISKCILADSTSIVDYILAESTLQKYGFTKEQIPALFLRQQYEMYFDTDAETFVRFMADEFKAFWSEERMQKLKKVGLNSPSEASTIASIVISEQSRFSDEWAIIAKTYLNRVKKGMRLEADPTFKFCWPDRLKGVEHLLNKHKRIDCPYNTYLYAGIPPGPICLTSKKAIDAVLNPANVDYIFLCGDGTGRHKFAKSLAEHNRNAEAYRKWLKEYKKQKQNNQQ